MIEEARAQCVHWHFGQFRKGGEPYRNHPIRVAERVKTPFQKVCAFLHDTVEDSDMTFEMIVSKFDINVAQTVFRLTRGKDEPYHHYIGRVLEDPDAVAVKIADICDNLNDNPSPRAIEKSLIALPRLLNYGN